VDLAIACKKIAKGVNLTVRCLFVFVSALTEGHTLQRVRNIFFLHSTFIFCSLRVALLCDTFVKRDLVHCVSVCV